MRIILMVPLFLAVCETGGSPNLEGTERGSGHSSSWSRDIGQQDQPKVRAGSVRTVEVVGGGKRMLANSRADNAVNVPSVMVIDPRPWWVWDKEAESMEVKVRREGAQRGKLGDGRRYGGGERGKKLVADSSRDLVATAACTDAGELAGSEEAQGGATRG